ncbi:STAS domain-containing protein [Candidatus Peregrinibacteria bacterium]|nr:STAS domain-containing protein [Candidatus Peregrinibacteria bacterium]
MRAWLLDLIHEPNCRGVLITFKEVGFMSTAMLGPLVTLERGMRLSNRKLVLSNVEEGMRKVMEITRLERVIPIRDNEEQGLEELKRAS